MSKDLFSRRAILGSLAAASSLSLLPASLSAKPKSIAKEGHTFQFCLNTSTIMEQKLGLQREIETAAAAGYDGVEIWIPTLNQFIEEGGQLTALKKRIDDLGIRIENAIGFAQWIVDDNDRRIAALEQAKVEMGLLAQLGCKRIAAPPAGATNVGGLDLYKAAERFRALLELGKSMGVIPQLEVWGFSKNLNRLSQVLFVAAECGHEDVRILPDVYHLYKGGSDFDGLKLLSGKTVEIFHMNDYPATPERAEIADKDRVYPGLGIAPISSILKDLHDPAYPTVLSLELFNRAYWKQDALEVAKMGLQKMKEAVEKAF